MVYKNIISIINISLIKNLNLNQDEKWALAGLYICLLRAKETGIDILWIVIVPFFLIEITKKLLLIYL